MAYRLFISCLVAGLLQCKYSLHLLGEKASGQSGEVPAVIITAPGEGTAGLGTNIKISLTYSQPMNAETISVNTTGTACSGTIQVSSDNFATCVLMSGDAASAQGNTVFTITPVSLTPFTSYKIRSTSAATTIGNRSLPSAYTSSAGFITASGPDLLAPQLILTPSFLYPSDTATNISLNTGISFFFSEPIAAQSAITNTADNACSGSLQLSLDDFATCVQMAAQPMAANGNRNFVMFPAGNLTSSTAYKIRMKAALTDLAGNAFSEVTTAFTTGTLAATAAPTVLSTSPADLATNVVAANFVQVTFNTTMNPTTLTTNTLDNACSGSVQVSNDNFQSCVKMLYPVLFPSNITSYLMTPEAPLANSATYRIRVTSAAKEIRGIAATPYTSPNGFSTEALAGGGAQVHRSAPGELSQFNNVQTPFTVIFTKPMLPGTVTVNTTDNTCAGYSFQIAIVGTNWTGTNCLRFAAQPVVSGGNTRFTVYPTTTLTPNAFYGIRITTAAQDFSAAAVTAYDSATGIKMAP